MAPRPPRPHRSEFPEFYRLQTRWKDNDMYGHMNNVVHYSLFDTAVNGWLIENGVLDPQQSESFGLVVETGCQYFSELSFPGWIDAGMRVAKIGSSSIRYEIALFGENEEEAAAKGFFVHVYVDRDTRRPVPIAPHKREVLSRLIVD